MPLHPWQTLDPGFFRDFRLSFYSEIRGKLNRELLDPAHYCLFEVMKSDDSSVTISRSLSIRRTSDHRIVSRIEIVPAETKSNTTSIHQFLKNAREMLEKGIHLLILDLYLPGAFDPGGLAALIWSEIADSRSELNVQNQGTLASFVASETPEVFLQPVSVGEDLPEVPLFLQRDLYVNVPLEPAYLRAWETFPSYWGDRLTETMKKIASA